MQVNKMRPVGQTGISVSSLGFGCASLGGLYKPVDASVAIATLQAAWDCGVRYFDVAPMYGDTRSEHLLGQFLRDDVDPGQMRS